MSVLGDTNVLLRRSQPGRATPHITTGTVPPSIVMLTPVT
jgi:hypothetical protein